MCFQMLSHLIPSKPESFLWSLWTHMTLHWGHHLSDLHSSLGSLEHAPSQSDPLQGLALLRLGARLCPESCRLCFSSPPAGSLLTGRCLSEAFPDHLSYFTIPPPPTLPILVDSLRVFLFFPQDFSHLDRLSVDPIYFLSSART